MKTPRASFVIPAYNAQKYLHSTLDSCLSQSIKEIEVIAVNDGSTDGTKELLDFYAKADPRIKPVHVAKNIGRSAARNMGNSLALSPFILVLDADDIACKNRVRDTLLAFQMKNPDVVYGPFQVVDEFGYFMGKNQAGPFNKDLALKHKQNFIGHSTMAYRKGVTLNVRYDEGDFSRLGLDDWKFQWDCFLAGYKFGVTKTVLSHYRYCRGNTEETRDKKEVEKIKDEYLARISDKLLERV